MGHMNFGGLQVQRGVGQFGGVCLHHDAGGTGLQQPLPGGEQRDAAVVHLQPPVARATTRGGESVPSVDSCFGTKRL